MMNRLLTLAILLISFNVQGQTKRLDNKHFHVEYEAETEEYAIASLKVLDFVRDEAVKYGFLLPDKLNFSIIRSNRNTLYIDYKHLKGITWEYNSMTNFLPPSASGKKNVYGLCHELGHLCMYHIINNKNNWVTKEQSESWADFFGNFMTDKLYQEFGDELWIEPHNYTETAGMSSLQQRLQADKEKTELKKFNECCFYWWELNEKIGFENMSQLFKGIKNNNVSNPKAKEKYFNTLISFIDDKDKLQLWYNKYADYLIRNKK